MIRSILVAWSLITIGAWANATTLLDPMAVDYNSKRFNEVNNGSTSTTRNEGVDYGAELTTRVGDRLYQIKVYSQNQELDIAEPIRVVGKPGFLSTYSATIKPGKYPALSAFKHPHYDLLIYVPNLTSIGYGFLVTGEGDVFPQLISKNDSNPLLISSEDIATISGGDIKVVLSEKLLAVYDAKLTAIDGGMITVTVTCFNPTGTVLGRKDYRFSDFAPNFILGGATIQMLSSNASSITYSLQSKGDASLCRW